MQQASSNTIQEMLGNTLRDFTNASLPYYQSLLQGIANNFMPYNKTAAGGGNGLLFRLPQLFKETCNCCPPDCECPPHCIASIYRCAAQGERVVVPFLVKNTCSHIKAYRVGVRELKDRDGKLAPEQPKLNRSEITLEAGRSEKVIMTLDLAKFANGAVYNTEIVVREKEINQNICFTLKIDNDHQLVTVMPQDEKQYNVKWQNWQSHYYCEPKKPATGTGQG